MHENSLVHTENTAEMEISAEMEHSAEMETFACRGCNRVFPDMRAFRIHTLTCIRPVKGTSFLNLLQREEPLLQGRGRDSNKNNIYEEDDTGEKTLPPSQPLTTTNEAVLDKHNEILEQEEIRKENRRNAAADIESTQQPTSSPNEVGEAAYAASPKKIITEQLGIQHVKPTAKCRICNREFDTTKGLNIHMRTCEKNNSKQRVNPNPNQNPNPRSDTTVEEQVNYEMNTQQRSAIWGNHTYEDVYQIGNALYEEIVYWKKNLFKLPSGAAGKRYIRELTRLIDRWNENSQPMGNIAIKLAMVMPALLLQKPSRKSTSKQHGEYLHKRMTMWESGQFDELIREARAIQHKLKQTTNRNETPEHLAKTFAKLMLQGKVNAALRLLDKEAALGVANLTEETLRDLRTLHPEAKPATDEILMEGEIPFFDPVIFSNIDDASIASAAMKTRGAAGPSGMDADGWRRILISKNYGNTGKDLRTSIAKMTQQLCTREVTVIEDSNKTNIEAYTACRLISLEKQPTGVRPIGIEVLRRIIGKAIIAEIKPELAESAGCLQLCAGQKAGCEAGAHAMRSIFEEEETDAVLLIDASNAFNSLNREALLHNIQYLCPPLSTYVRNCYGTPARLFVAGGEEITSSEGTTQGDPTAMPSYAIGILPFLSIIKPEVEPEKMKHAAYADDLGGGSKLEKVRDWWDRCVTYGPAIGYYPKASKSWLIVKEDQFEKAREIFHGTGVKITTEGRKYLGGFIGTKEGTENYVKELVSDWVNQLEQLTMIAKSEPQAAYTAFTGGFKHRMTYFIRTIPNLKEVLKPLDEVINSQFIPAITEGHACSEDDRRLLSLPVRLGGLGIPIFTELCEREFKNSAISTQQLTEKILEQETEYSIDKNKQKEVEAKMRKERNDHENNMLEDIRKRMSREQLRANDIAQMKGASSWLNALPLKEEGYTLNKREFFDAIALRYRWRLRRLPLNCACGKKFEVDHAMNCMKGGFIHRRHDGVRDIIAQIVDGVAYDVQIEPPLQPLTGEALPNSANRDDEARLDIAARGFWQKGEMAFFDVRVFNPFAKTHLNSKLDTVFKQNEASKKREYNERVIKIEHGTFTPIVTSAYGGYGRETSRFLSTLIAKIAEKQDMQTSAVANYVRTKLSFEIVRSQVLCIRGSRSLRKSHMDISDVELVQNVAEIRE